MSSSNSLLPGVNHFISLKQAKEMTARYRSEKENILLPEYRNKDILLICETFDRSAFDALLNEKDCAGLRIYFGMDVDLKIRVISVAVDPDNNDILPPAEDAVRMEDDGDDDANIVEQGQTCPDFCPTPPL